MSATLTPIIHVQRKDLLQALKSIVMFGRRQTTDTARALIAYAEASNISLDHCWAMRQTDGRLHPVCLALPSPGATAMIFTSETGNSRNLGLHEQTVEVLRYTLQHIDRSQTHLAQALIARSESGTGKLLLDSGFQWLAALSYLERRIGDKDRTLAADNFQSSGFSFEPHDACGPEGNEADFSAVIEASYEQTLDCPGLRGLRTMPEVMEGHKATGHFCPDLWTLARCTSTGRPAGVLLLNPLTPLSESADTLGVEPDDVTAELVYLGIHPNYRRRRLARRLMEFGLAKLAAAKRVTRLVLAVDEDNDPARQLYKSLAFYRTDRRIAYVYPLH